MKAKFSSKKTNWEAVARAVDSAKIRDFENIWEEILVEYTAIGVNKDNYPLSAVKNGARDMYDKIFPKTGNEDMPPRHQDAGTTYDGTDLIFRWQLAGEENVIGESK